MSRHNISQVHRQVELERAETESKFSRQNSRSSYHRVVCYQMLPVVDGGGGRGGLSRSRTSGFGSSSRLDKKGSGLHRTVSRTGSVPHGLSATGPSRLGKGGSRVGHQARSVPSGSRGSMPVAPTPAPWAARSSMPEKSRSNTLVVMGPALYAADLGSSPSSYRY